MLDCGLTAEQRELLEAEATVVSGADGRAPLPAQDLRPAAPSRARSMVLIDADMIVTRPLGRADRSGGGRTGGRRRARAWTGSAIEWGEMLGLASVAAQTVRLLRRSSSSGGDARRRGPAPRRRAAGPRRLRAHLLRGATSRAIPLLHAEEDVLNAAIAARVPASIGSSPSTRGCRPARRSRACGSPTSARCAASTRDGSEPYVVHHWLGEAVARARPTTASTRAFCAGC